MSIFGCLLLIIFMVVLTILLCERNKRKLLKSFKEGINKLRGSYEN